MKQALACIAVILLESVMLFTLSHFSVSSETASQICNGTESLYASVSTLVYRDKNEVCVFQLAKH